MEGEGALWALSPSPYKTTYSLYTCLTSIILQSNMNYISLWNAESAYPALVAPIGNFALPPLSGFRWVPGWFWMGYRWVPAGFKMGSKCVTGRFQMGFGWVSGEFQFGSNRAPGGLRLVSRWVFGWWVPDRFLVGYWCVLLENVWQKLYAFHNQIWMCFINKKIQSIEILKTWLFKMIIWLLGVSHSALLL